MTKDQIMMNSAVGRRDTGYGWGRPHRWRIRQSILRMILTSSPVVMDMIGFHLTHKFPPTCSNTNTCLKHTNVRMSLALYQIQKRTRCRQCLRSHGRSVSPLSKLETRSPMVGRQRTGPWFLMLAEDMMSMTLPVSV